MAKSKRTYKRIFEPRPRNYPRRDRRNYPSRDRQGAEIKTERRTSCIARFPSRDCRNYPRRDHQGGDDIYSNEPNSLKPFI